MKKILTILLCAVRVCALAACGKPAETKIEAESALALDALLAPLKSGEFANTSILADSAFANEDAAMLDGIFGKFDYTIGDVTEETDTATVAVEITMVDMGALFTAYLTEAMQQDSDWDADGSYFAEMAKGEDAATKTFAVDVQMVKDAEGVWTVSAEGNEALYNALTGGLLDSLGGLEDMLQ